MLNDTKDLKLHDKVKLYEIMATQIWKSHLEYPTGLWSGTPVLYIYSNKYATYKKPAELDKNYYLFQIIKGTSEYEVMMIGENFDEVVKKGNELQDAYRIEHFEKNEDNY